MIFAQTDLLFPTNAVPPAGTLPAGAQLLELQTTDGEHLHGVYIPPEQDTPGARTLILGFGGNAWNGQHVAAELHQLFPEAHVVAFHYRGYRPSTGRPSAAALIQDAPLVYDLAVERVKPSKTVAVGFSIGSGVAAHLSSQRGLNGLILVTPFDSLKRAASDLFPWLPVGTFFQHELATADELKGGATPIAIVAAERDEIIRPQRTAALRSDLHNLVFDRTIGGAGHNDIYHRVEFKTAMRQALQAVVAGKKWE